MKKLQPEPELIRTEEKIRIEVCPEVGTWYYKPIIVWKVIYK
jgi:hypothetical protein